MKIITSSTVEFNCTKGNFQSSNPNLASEIPTASSNSLIDPYSGKRNSFLHPSSKFPFSNSSFPLPPFRISSLFYQKKNIMAWNVFKFCTALRALGSIMIVFILAIIGVTYYSVVITHYGPSLFLGGFDSVFSIVALIVFHSLLIMVMWCYSSVVLTDPGDVPPNWRPLTDEEKGDADPLLGSGYGNADLESKQLVTPTDYSSQDIRFCHKCEQFKPPRTHHCSEVNTKNGPSLCLGCQLCWGIELQVFPSILFYTFFETTLVSLLLLRVFMEFFNDGEIDETPGTLATTFITFVLNLAFALSILGFLIMHTALDWLEPIPPLLRHMRRKPVLSGVMTLVGKRIFNRYLD